MEPWELEQELHGLTSLQRDALVLAEVRATNGRVRQHDILLYGDPHIESDHGLNGQVTELVLWVAAVRTMANTLKAISYVILAANTIGLLLFFSRIATGH